MIELPLIAVFLHGGVLAAIIIARLALRRPLIPGPPVPFPCSPGAIERFQEGLRKIAKTGITTDEAAIGLLRTFAKYENLNKEYENLNKEVENSDFVKWCRKEAKETEHAILKKVYESLGENNEIHHHPIEPGTRRLRH